MFGNPERTTVMGDNGVLGYTEKEVEPGIECTIAHRQDVSLSELAKITGKSITFETDTGKTYILRSGWLKNSLELTASDNGEVSLQFSGMSCEEIS